GIHDSKLSGLRVLHRYYHFSRDHLRVIDHPIDRVDRSSRNTIVLEQFYPFVGPLRLGYLHEKRFQFLSIARAIFVRSEARIFRKLWLRHCGTKFLPLLVGADREAHVAVKRPYNLHGSCNGMSVALALRDLSRVKVAAERVFQERYLAIQHTDIY